MEKRNQITENIKLALTLKENGVKKLNLSSWGNSIASSYSMAFETKPLLERNTTLEEILKDHGITLQKSHFARFENNNDENVLIIKNHALSKAYRNYFYNLYNSIDDKYLYRYVRAESFESVNSCFDGIDNNFDGLIDSKDKGCIR